MCPKELLISLKAHIAFSGFPYMLNSIWDLSEWKAEYKHLGRQIMHSDFFLCHSPIHGAYSCPYETSFITKNNINCQEQPLFNTFASLSLVKLFVARMPVSYPNDLLVLSKLFQNNHGQVTSFCNSQTGSFSSAPTWTRDSNILSHTSGICCYITMPETLMGHLHITHWSNA